MTTPQQPQYAWTLTGPGAASVHVGDPVTITTGGQAVQGRVVALQPFPGGVQVTAERIEDT